MKVAVLSDIHANGAALAAVLAHLEGAAPDAVMVGGDIINRGPHPRECLELILKKEREEGWVVIKGNHEDYVLRAAAAGPPAIAWERQVIAHTFWTLDRIGEHLHHIAGWPDLAEVAAPDGSRAICFHASHKGNRIGLYEFMTLDELREHARPASPVLCVGHTHIPFVRELEGKLVVNAGAVGMPFDGNPHASYALLDWSAQGWSAEIIRVPYDRRITERAYVDTGYLDQGGPMVPLILEELMHSTSRLGVWHRHYETRVAQGELTVEESVSLLRKEHPV